MAIKKVIEIDVDVLNANGGLDALQNQFKETEKQGESLRSELRRLKQQLAELPEGSAEYNKIAQRAGEVSDKISDISSRVKNLGSDTKNIDAVVGGVQALSGAFSIATSASALLGSENKDLQETMLKVESAIGLTVGIQSVANALQKETALSIGLSTVATKAQTVAQVAYATVVGTTTGALKALRVALVSTGLGALVVGLGFLIAKMTESTEATEDQDEALKALTETQKRYTDSLKNEISGIERLTQTRVLKAKVAGKSEKELREIEKDGEAERATAYNSELKRIDKELENRKLSAKAYAQLLEERNKIADESLKLAYDRDNAQLEFEVGIADKRRDAQKKSREDAEAQEKADREKARKEKEDFDKSVAQGEIDLQIATNNAKFANDLEIKKQADEVLKSLEPAETPLQKLTREFEEKKSILELANESTLELQSQFITASEALDQEARDKQKAKDDEELARKKIIKEQELALAGATFGKVAELLGKNSKVGKAFAISQALINTYQGITAELATKAATPFEFGVKLVNIASVAAIGFKAVKNIISTKADGGGGGAPSIGSAGGGAGGGGAQAPSFNVVGNSGVNQIAQTLNREQAPIQAYVVANNVTTAQSANRSIIENASLG
jgi:chromosome segregation ATPase